MFTKIDKAITAFIVAAAGTLAAAPATGGSVSSTVLITAIVLGLVAGLGVWLVPNKPA